jgi:hypothetical protein
MSDGSWAGGKGSKPRKVDRKKFDENFDRIFGKPKPPKSEQKYPKKAQKND